jgi:SAM-dependent methyltransferase
MRALGRRIADHPVLHPTRFYGDLQRRSGTRNLHRTLLEFLRRFRPQQRILDLGSGGRRLGPSTVSFDIVHLDGLDVQGDGHALPFRDASFDGVVAQAVLEHVVNPITVLAEMQRVLKGDGRVYIEVPFLYPVHDDEHDYWRWTEHGFKLMTSQFFRKQQLGVIMGASSALSILLRNHLACIVSRNRRPLHGALCTAIGLFTFWIKYVDEWMNADRDDSMRNTAACYYFIGER